MCVCDYVDRVESILLISILPYYFLEMASYLHSIDVYGHLISNSYSNSDGDEKVQALSALDFTMTHNYGSSDIAEDTAQYVYTSYLLFENWLATFISFCW